MTASAGRASPQVPTDEMLMLRYRDGDDAGFEQLYQRHKGPLYRYFLRQCSDSGSADELFQDVWLKLIGARARYDVKARFTTYLYHMAHNRLIDHYRAQARGLPRSYAGAEPLEPDALPASELAQPEQREVNRRLGECLLKVLADLPAAQREAFLMQQESGLSLDEIAVATGVARETVKSRLRYAVAKIRAAMRHPTDSNAPATPVTHRPDATDGTVQPLAERGSHP